MSETKYPLGYDVDGNPLDVPAEAVAWRVRKGGGRRGRPRTVFDGETGRQLEIPIAAGIQDLTALDLEADRYRLEAVDQTGRIIPGIVALVEIAESDEQAGEREQAKSLDAIEKMTQLVAHLVDANCRSIQAMAGAFGPLGPAQAQALPPPQPIVVGESQQKPSVDPQMVANLVMMLIDKVATIVKPAGAAPAPAPTAGSGS